MTKVLILVEGQTELQFIKGLIASHLASVGVYMVPTIIETRPPIGSASSQGGYVTYTKLKKQILNMVGDVKARVVTTMFDFYGPITPNIPGWKMWPPGSSVHKQVEYLEKAFKDDIPALFERPLLPYFALHEFEALLFSAPEKFAVAFPDLAVSKPTSKPKKSVDDPIEKLKKIRNQFDTPEEINHENAPSKRIIEILPRYKKSKPLFGQQIAQAIGLPAMRAACPHFDSWLKQIEALAAKPAE